MQTIKPEIFVFVAVVCCTKYASWWKLYKIFQFLFSAFSVIYLLGVANALRLFTSLSRCCFVALRRCSGDYWQSVTTLHSRFPQALNRSAIMRWTIQPVRRSAVQSARKITKCNMLQQIHADTHLHTGAQRHPTTDFDCPTGQSAHTSVGRSAATASHCRRCHINTFKLQIYLLSWALYLLASTRIFSNIFSAIFICFLLLCSALFYSFTSIC